MTGLVLSHPDLVFDPNCSHTLCRICGAVYQSAVDRNPKGDKVHALVKRRAWSFVHAKSHSEAQHAELLASGRWCTPEAAQKLAAFGVIPLVDMVMDDEVNDALAKGHVIPVEDCEGGNDAVL